MDHIRYIEFEPIAQRLRASKEDAVERLALLAIIDDDRPLFNTMIRIMEKRRRLRLISVV